MPATTVTTTTTEAATAMTTAATKTAATTATSTTKTASIAEASTIAAAAVKVATVAPAIKRARLRVHTRLRLLVPAGFKITSWSTLVLLLIIIVLAALILIAAVHLAGLIYSTIIIRRLTIKLPIASALNIVVISICTAIDLLITWPVVRPVIAAHVITAAAVDIIIQ